MLPSGTQLDIVVTNYQLLKRVVNRSLSCYAIIHNNIFSQFYWLFLEAPARNVTTYIEDPLSIHAAVPVLVILVVFVVALVVIVRLNMEARMWCNVNVVQRSPCCKLIIQIMSHCFFFDVFQIGCISLVYWDFKLAYALCKISCL